MAGPEAGKDSSAGSSCSPTQRHLASKDMLIISPNKVFTDYISNVLLVLGEKICRNRNGDSEEHVVGL